MCALTALIELSKKNPTFAFGTLDVVRICCHNCKSADVCPRMSLAEFRDDAIDLND